MPHITHCIDWLQYSLDWPATIAEWPIDDKEELAIVRTCIPHFHVSGLPPERAKDNHAQGMQGWTRFYDMLWATVGVNPQYKSQKIGVRMTGGDMGAYRDLGGTEARLVQFVNRNRATTSRVDIAFDLFDYGIDVLKMYDDWKRGRLEVRARTARPVTEGVMTDAGVVEASSVYFGSRTSETMLRVYEKGKETGTGIDWVRVELELKGDRAIAVMRDCERLGVGPVGAQLLRDYVKKCPYKFWKELVKGDSVELTTAGRKKTERQIWLENTIFPLIQAEVEAEWDSGEFTGITERLEAIIRGNWQRRAIEIKKQRGYLPNEIFDWKLLEGGRIHQAN